MSQRIFSLLVVLLFSRNGEVFAQNNYWGNSFKEFSNQSITYDKLGLIPMNVNHIKNYPTKGLKNIFRIPNFSQKQVVYTPNLPFSPGSFFCRQEYRLEQKTGVALRLRLGSVDYVDRLEGKTN